MNYHLIITLLLEWKAGHMFYVHSEIRVIVKIENAAIFLQTMICKCTIFNAAIYCFCCYVRVFTNHLVPLFQYGWG